MKDDTIREEYLKLNKDHESLKEQKRPGNAHLGGFYVRLDPNRGTSLSGSVSEFGVCDFSYEERKFFSEEDRQKKVSKLIETFGYAISLIFLSFGESDIVIWLQLPLGRKEIQEILDFLPSTGTFKKYETPIIHTLANDEQVQKARNDFYQKLSECVDGQQTEHWRFSKDIEQEKKTAFQITINEVKNIQIGKTTGHNITLEFMKNCSTFKKYIFPLEEKSFKKTIERIRNAQVK
ncbi:MAG: hypothetical protein J4215_04385 [Candidatus Diapherotrites archaeon]|uniref:Uncharacterized protein n=1 Tax=Candidatus Iainarchaeum sp. TaxID=3101447 RepID=A0A8T4L4N8_9ARCH|nr:hypothetical protein [Candidatus Diapherotrites archaeon]